MKAFWRDTRLIPIVLLAMVSLFSLKVLGLVFNGGYTLAERLRDRDKNEMKVVAGEAVPSFPKIIIDGNESGSQNSEHPPSWAREMFNYGGINKADITGSVDSDKNKSEEPPLKTSNSPPPPPKLQVGDTSVQMEPGRVMAPGEKAVLERLQERRRELDSRNHEIEMRENLVREAEKRLQAKVGELKDTETRIKTSIEGRDKAEKDRLKNIVTMYETMKPKDAARIFDRLSVNILVRVSTAMKPRAMSEILAQMSPEAAEKLTVELANRASAEKMEAPEQLPKIEGKPSQP
jgi:flagellar motility protein MotE (MotC chaperone)